MHVGGRLVSRTMPIGRGRAIRMTLPLALAVIAAAAAGTSAHASDPNVRVNVPYVMTVRILDEIAGKYQVEFDNTNPAKLIDDFKWTPPGGMTISAINSTTGGRCLILEGIIECKGQWRPASCDSGECIGGSMKVDFTATGKQPTFVQTSYGGYWNHYGVIGTIVVHTATFSDLPLCKKGQKSTRAHPCTKG